MLARLAGQSLTNEQRQGGVEFAQQFQDFWNKHNDDIFSFFKEHGFVLPDYWFAYPVHKWKNLIPFDDPLTFFIQEDFDLILAEVVHEICHTFFSYYENKEVSERLWNGIQKKFADEDETTKGHLLVILMTEACLIKIFGAEKAEELLVVEKHFEGLERAWQILDANPSTDKLNFVERINNLAPAKLL